MFFFFFYIRYSRNKATLMLPHDAMYTTDISTLFQHMRWNRIGGEVCVVKMRRGYGVWLEIFHFLPIVYRGSIECADTIMCSRVFFASCYSGKCVCRLGRTQKWWNRKECNYTSMWTAVWRDFMLWENDWMCGGYYCFSFPRHSHALYK